MRTLDWLAIFWLGPGCCRHFCDYSSQINRYIWYHLYKVLLILVCNKGTTSSSRLCLISLGVFDVLGCKWYFSSNLLKISEISPFFLFILYIAVLRRKIIIFINLLLWKMSNIQKQWWTYNETLNHLPVLTITKADLALVKSPIYLTSDLLLWRKSQTYHFKCKHVRM